MLRKIPWLIFIYMALVPFQTLAQWTGYKKNDIIDPENFQFHTLLAGETFQLILDVEDPCFEFLGGDWTLKYDGVYNGYYYFIINGPGTGSGRGRWIAEGLPKGKYLVEFLVNYNDYAEDARYEVVCTDGIIPLTVNMNYLADGWHPLGTFNINRTCVVNVSDYWEKGGTKVAVDALRFTLQSQLPEPPETVVPPHIGICIDDAGGVNPKEASRPIYKMLRLPFNLTIAVMPYRSYTNQTAEEVYKWGSEVILHQPMAAISISDPGAGGITDAMSLEDVRKIVAENLDALPHVAGMNNHMGSLITQQKDKMQVCMEELKKRNLFFFDSRTYTYSVGYDVGKENGLLTGERDVFIDGKNKEESKELIRNLAFRALHAPYVPHLGIGHIYSNTASALEEIAPELEALGVEVWPISRCMAQVIETDCSPAGCSVEFLGNWINNENDCYSKELHDDQCVVVYNPAATRLDTCVFTPSLPIPGLYDIYVAWMTSDSNTTESQAFISHKYGVTPVSIDQSESLLDWMYFGRFPLEEGTGSSVTLTDSGCTVPGKTFVADTVKFVYAGPIETLAQKYWLLY